MKKLTSQLIYGRTILVQIQQKCLLMNKTNKVYNADLNGALNIAIKELGGEVKEQFLRLQNWLDKLSRPIKLNLFNKYSAIVLKDIADSNSLSSDRRRTLSETFC